LDCRLPVEVNPLERWDLTYGPDLVDAVLDALMDGAHGPLALVSDEGWTTADFVRAVAHVAEAQDALVREQTRPTVRYTATPPAERWAFRPVLPPGETTAKRFVRESRHARAPGAAAVERRADEPRLKGAG
jgi:dTDP-4-dehydrorhamnose reductase